MDKEQKRRLGDIIELTMKKICTELELIERGDATLNYVQCIPNNANPEDWGQHACHYEFCIDGDKNCVEIRFHAEKDFADHKTLKPKVNKFIKEEFSKITGPKYRKYKEYYRVDVLDEDNFDTVANDAVELMLEFYNSFGQEIQLLIDECKETQ